MNLAGIRVLDLTQLLPGPYGSQLLADLGAEVLKVEPPGGDPARLFREQDGWAGYVFSAVNSDKSSLELDLKQDRGRAVFYELVADADVVFEQFRPGVVDRLGIDYETLSEYNEELIYCSLTGYGQKGPYADRAGHDLNYVGVAGLVDMTRHSPDGSPTAPGYPIADMTGGLLAATSIVSALLSRELGNTGGEYIDLAMTDAVLSLAQVEVAMADAGLDPRPGETPISGGLPWYDVYETSDGRHITLAALEPRFWYAFCETIDRPDLVEYHMTQDEDELDWLREELIRVFATHSREEWDERLGSIDDAMFGLVNTPAEVIEDPHISQREILEETGEGHRRIRFPVSASSNGETPGPGRDVSPDESAVPALGEHTEQVLRAHGFEPSEIAQLREDGVI